MVTGSIAFAFGTATNPVPATTRSRISKRFFTPGNSAENLKRQDGAYTLHRRKLFFHRSGEFFRDKSPAHSRRLPAEEPKSPAPAVLRLPLLFRQNRGTVEPGVLAVGNAAEPLHPVTDAAVQIVDENAQAQRHSLARPGIQRLPRHCDPVKRPVPVTAVIEPDAGNRPSVSDCRCTLCGRSSKNGIPGFRTAICPRRQRIFPPVARRFAHVLFEKTGKSEFTAEIQQAGNFLYGSVSI